MGVLPRTHCSRCAVELTPTNRVNGKCRDCDRVRHRERYWKDPKAGVARVVDWQRRNREKARALNKRWREAHPEHSVNDQARLAALPKSIESARARCKRHRARHPEQTRMQNKRWRARLRGAKGNFTRAEWKAQLAWFGHRCAYCGGTHDITADHVIDLNRGGEHTFENIVPACRSCNSRKKHRGILSMVNVSFAPEAAHAG